MTDGECHGIRLVYDVLRQCVSSDRHTVSLIIGFASIICSTFANVPQIVVNFRRKSTEGVSINFIILLLVGDLANLLGVYVDRLLAVQFVTALLFILIDSALVVQHLAFGSRRRRIDFRAPNGLLAFVAVAGADNWIAAPYKEPLLKGTLCGWVSALAYIASRVPQIVTNFERKRTDGLAVTFFLASLAGNVLYGASVLIDNASLPYIWMQLPWFVGSLGTVLFDVIIVIQFRVYEKRDADVPLLGK